MTIRKCLILPRYHVVYLLLLVVQVTGQPQPGTVGPYRQLRRDQVPVVIIGMLIFTLLFSMIACCVCYAYRSTSPPGTNTTDTDERGGAIPWTRRTSRGLEKDVIMSFPSFLYSQVKGLKIGKGGVECAICLNEFDDGETLRLMPACSHAFHADCIDVWLSSCSTCPVCRDNLAPNKLGNSQNFIYPFIRPRTSNQDMDLEMGNASGLESPDVRLLDRLTRSTNNNTGNGPPRSRSTGSSSHWQITELLFPRSHSTGHSLIPLGENLDRFTLQLPEELRKQLSQRKLPQARSSREGYRCGSVGSQGRGIPNGRGYNHRTISLSFSFSFQSKGKDKEFGEGSLERLRPEMPLS